MSFGLCSSIGHSTDEGSCKGALKSLKAIPIIETVHCQCISSIVLYNFFLTAIWEQGQETELSQRHLKNRLCEEQIRIFFSFAKQINSSCA